MRHSPVLATPKSNFNDTESPMRCYPYHFTWGGWDDPDCARRTKFFPLIPSPTGTAPVLVSLRPSSEHILIVRAPGVRDQHGWHSTPFIVRVPRAKELSQLPASYGCATLQLCPVPKSTFSGTDNPSFFPVASISVFTR